MLALLSIFPNIFLWDHYIYPFRHIFFHAAAVKFTLAIPFLSVSDGKCLLIMLKILSLRRGKRKRHDAFYMVKSAMFVNVLGIYARTQADFECGSVGNH